MNKVTLGSLALFTLLLFGVLSCKKSSNDNRVSVVHPPTTIVLNAPQVSGNVVKLTWTKSNDSPAVYVIVKVADTTNSMEQYDRILLDDTTSYIDTLPVTPYTQYYVIAELNNGKRMVNSNKQTAVRTDLKFMNIVPFDALFDNISKKLYIYNTNGDIAIYDVQNNTLVKQVAVPGPIGYCALGSYNGTTELYIPCNNGTLYIYNAATLEKIDEIIVGLYASSVTYNNGQLFVSKDYSDGGIICYSRSTKMGIDSNGFFTSVRLKLIPGTSNDFFAIDNSEAYHLKYSTSGHLVYAKSGGMLDGSLSSFEVFPTSRKFISGRHGTVLDDSLAFQATLSNSNDQFTSFTFDAGSNLIYATCFDKKKVQTYHMNSYYLQDKIVLTQGYPQKIFFDNGKLIIVSLSDDIPYSNFSRGYCFVEQF